MLHKFFLSCSFIICSCITSNSQDKKFLYFFDENLKPVKKSKSAFTGTGTMENGLLALQLVNNQNQIIIRAHYTDPSLTVSQGLFQSFFTNGIKESEGNYDNGKERGLWKKWDKTGRLVDSTIYDQGKKIMSTTITYYKKNTMTRIEDFINDKMQEVNYNDSGKLTSEVFFTGNSGIAKSYNKEGVKIDSVFSRESRDASFPGGDVAWNKHIKNEISKNINAIINDNRTGTCRLRFIVDKEGNVKSVEPLTLKGSVLADVAVNAVKNGPKWNPAIQYGKPVNAYREQPVTFTIQNSR